MFSKRSQSSVVTPEPHPAIPAARISILNTGLAFALMEEKGVAALMEKLSSAHMESMNHLMQWAKSQSSPLFSVIYGKVAEMTWMWSQILTEASEKYGSYVKILQDIFSDERAIEETHKAAGIAQRQVSKAQKSLDSLKKKSDSSKHSVLQRELETATMAYDMLSTKLIDQMGTVQNLQLKNIRKSLSVQAGLFQSVADSCNKLFSTQQQLAELIPEDHGSLCNEDMIKDTEYSMSECIFGLAENLDLWPPDAGGVKCVSPLKGPHLSSSSISANSMMGGGRSPSEMRRYDSECSPVSSSLQGSQESLTGVHVPPALPPRSPISKRRSKILRHLDSEGIDNSNNNNARGRCKSLSLYEKKLAGLVSSKDSRLVPDLKRSSQVTDDMRGWAVHWKNSRRPGSVHFGMTHEVSDEYRRNTTPSAPASQSSFRPHYQSNPDLLQSFKKDVEAHYVIPVSSQVSRSRRSGIVIGDTATSPHQQPPPGPERGGEGEGPVLTPPLDAGIEDEDPYCLPADALASFTPSYQLHRQTTDSYPVLRKVSDTAKPMSSGLFRMRFHCSADNINAVDLGHTDTSDEGVYSVPFDVLAKQRRQRKSTSPASVILTKDVNSLSGRQSESAPPRESIPVRRTTSLSQDKYSRGEVNPRKKWMVNHTQKGEWSAPTTTVSSSPSPSSPSTSNHEVLPPRPQIDPPPQPGADVLPKYSSSVPIESSETHDYCEIELFSDDLPPERSRTSPSPAVVKNSEFLFGRDTPSPNSQRSGAGKQERNQSTSPSGVSSPGGSSGRHSMSAVSRFSPAPVEVAKLKSSKPKLVSLTHK